MFLVHSPWKHKRFSYIFKGESERNIGNKWVKSHWKELEPLILRLCQITKLLTEIGVLYFLGKVYSSFSLFFDVFVCTGIILLHTQPFKRYITILNPYLANVPILYPLNTPEYQSFSDAFRRYRNVTLGYN